MMRLRRNTTTKSLRRIAEDIRPMQSWLSTLAVRITENGDPVPEEIERALNGLSAARGACDVLATKWQSRR